MFEFLVVLMEPKQDLIWLQAIRTEIVFFNIVIYLSISMDAFYTCDSLYVSCAKLKLVDICE